MADATSALKMIKDQDIKFVDLRFTDAKGKWQHVTFDQTLVDEDFFEEVGIVRYRSRRDMLQMTNSPDFIKAEPHKWASMEKTVVVPTKKLLMLDLGVLVPLALFLIWLLVN